MIHALPRNVLLACVAAAATAGPAGAAPAGSSEGDWRAARWGMTEGEILEAFPGEARRLDHPEKLADGNTVAIGIDRHAIGTTSFRVRFVFGPTGTLALVSLRTDPRTYAQPAAFAATRDALAGGLGRPRAESSDDNYVDLRQASWWTERSRIDVKYVNGVVVVLYSPTDGGPPASEGVPPLLARPPPAPAKT